MSAITTHVLDAVLGKPAPGIDVRLEKKIAGDWLSLSEGSTDSDGRCRDLCHDGGSGAYRRGAAPTSQLITLCVLSFTFSNTWSLCRFWSAGGQTSASV